MPVKWDAATDQVLLLKILETSSVSADVKAIAEAWPDHLDRPTPRAIQERLVKIRAMAKSSGSTAQFSVTNGKPASTDSTPVKSTPRKRAAPVDSPLTVTPTTIKTDKRARVEDATDSDDIDSPLAQRTTATKRQAADTAKTDLQAIPATPGSPSASSVTIDFSAPSCKVTPHAGPFKSAKSPLSKSAATSSTRRPVKVEAVQIPPVSPSGVRTFGGRQNIIRNATGINGRDMSKGMNMNMDGSDESWMDARMFHGIEAYV